ncbi:sensor histidine kinase [Cohnella abietis]|uniref:histidine kinase n=1 Tax=Cohnella abietis TaxID=2507935 RepID=A0A3T1DEQ8_9BACL|nr:sensor histidine kinase [Cohnella abietis]BBI36610.1 hypothetical protein KCTCHS21_60090 [Cohnella abietis]
MRMLRYVSILNIICLFLVAFTVTAHASDKNKTLNLVDSLHTYSLNPYIEVLADFKGNWSYSDVSSSSMDKSFQTAHGKSSFGYEAAVYWVRVSIRNDSAKVKWEISLKNPLMNKVEVYGLNQVTALQRNIPTFAVQLPQGKVSTLYIRSETPDTMIIPLQLAEQSTLYKSTHIEFLTLGLYFGAMLIIVICLFALYISTKNRAFFYYSLYILFYSVANYVWNGLAGIYSGTGPITEKVGRTILFDTPAVAYEFYFVLSVWFGCLFLRNIMSPASYAPKIDGLLRCMIWVCPLVLIAIVSMYPLGIAPYVAQFKMVIIVLMIAVIIGCAWKGNRMAKYLALAKIPAFLAIVVPSTLLSYGVLTDTFFTHYAIQFGSLGEFIITAIVVAKQLSRIQKDNEQAQLILVETLAKWNVDLKETVDAQKESLRRKNDELIITEAKRMELLSNISQEVRSPLNHVQESIELIMKQTEMEPEQQEGLLARAFDKLQDINHHVDGFLDLSHDHNEQDALQMVIFMEWIEDIFTGLAADIEERGHRCEVLISSPDCDADVLLEPLLMRRVVQNLVENACACTPLGGMITLQASHQHKTVRIMVGDSGDGEETEQRLAGLAAAKEIVERHGGELWADNELGQGSRYYVSLPLMVTE